MPFRVIDIEETPNPNALKFNLDGVICTETESYLSPEEAAGREPLAEALFAITGVTGVMFCRDFVTINKKPRTPWPKIRDRVEKALAEASRAPVAVND